MICCYALLLGDAGVDAHVSVRSPGDTIEFLGVTYQRTDERTLGGWLVYRRAG